jgi:hypothetical protein
LSPECRSEDGRISVETHWVDIDLDAQIALGALGGIEPESDIAAEVEIASTLREEPDAVVKAIAEWVRRLK